MSRDKSDTLRKQLDILPLLRISYLKSGESERSRVRLEEEMRSYDEKLNSMRQAMDEMVSTLSGLPQSN